MNIVYVSNADSGDIRVLRLAADGALEELQRFELGGMVMPMAVSPDRRMLYAVRRSEPLAVATLAIEVGTGRLRKLAEAPLPASMAYLACDRSGRFLLSASYGGHQLAVSPVDAQGIAQAAQQVLATPPNAHAVQTDPSNRWAFATSLGGDQVLQYRFDAATGRLAPNDPPSLAVRAGAGPRHFRFHPNGRFVYLMNELDATIDLLAFDAARGTLAPLQTVPALPPGFDGGAPWGAELHLTPDGRFLYASERRSSTLAAYAVDAASGRLRSIGHVPTEREPRGFAIDPSGRFLLAAGQASHRLSVHAIDPASGSLSMRGSHAMGQNPNWVEIVDLP